MNKQWGYVRETKEAASKAGIDPDTGICRTGLEEYLQVIYPNINDWIHDKSIILPDGKSARKRPDYRSESLKIIVEFDGVTGHYTDPEKIREDEMKNDLYKELGYKVIRIPYFIPLTNQTVFELFGETVQEPLFNPDIPSLGIKGKNTPAYLCMAGIERMAREFVRFPEQFKINKNALLKEDNEYLTGVNMLIDLYNKFK